MATIIPSVNLTTLTGNTNFSLSADKFLTSVDVNGAAVITVNNNGTVQSIPITISSSAMATLFNNVVNNTIVSCTLATGQTLYLATARIVKIYDNGTNTTVQYWDAYKEVNQYYFVTDAAATLSGNTGTTVPVTPNPTTSIMVTKTISTYGNTFTVHFAGNYLDYVSLLPINSTVTIFNSTYNNGTYTLASAPVDGGGGTVELIFTTSTLNTLVNDGDIILYYTPSVIYINNAFIVNMAIGASPNGANLALNSSSLATAGTGVTAIAGTLAGGTFTEAATVKIDTIQPVSLATNAAGSSYNVGDTILTAGGTASVHTTLTVSHIKAVAIPVVVAGGTGYTTGDFIEVTTGTGTKAQYTVAATLGVVTSLTAVHIAGDYTVRPTLGVGVATAKVTGAGNDDLTVTLVAADFGVLTAGITSAGSYTVGSATFTQASSSGAGTGATFNTVVYGAETYHVTDAGEYSVAPASPTTVTIAGATGVTLNTVFTNSVTEITYDDKESQTTPILYVSETPTYINALVAGLY